jgi:hypothetical protein
MENKKIVYMPIKRDGDRLVLYGAGKFKEASLSLDKKQASLLFAELWSFLDMPDPTKKLTDALQTALRSMSSYDNLNKTDNFSNSIRIAKEALKETK